MTRTQLLQEVALQLRDEGVEDARYTAELLLAHALKRSRDDLYLNPQVAVSSGDEESFRACARRIIAGEPLQYITGHCEFYGLPLTIGPGALIPRPETELIIDLTARLLPTRPVDVAMDLGTGSGALALALLDQQLASTVLAVDSSADALAWAARNAVTHGYKAVNVEGDPSAAIRDVSTVRLERDILDTRTHRQQVDSLWLIRTDAFAVTFRPPLHPAQLIVSNPPYVTDAEYHDLPPHIKQHEPRSALVSGEDGLGFHRRLTRRLKNWLAPGGLFLGEIGSTQGPAATELHRAWAARAELHQDYGGHDRIVAAWKG